MLLYIPYTYGIYFLILIIQLSNLCGAQEIAYSPTDTNIRYYGRWNQSDNIMISWWPGAYVKFNFTGTSLKIKLRSSANILYKINDNEFAEITDASETVDLASKLGPGPHSALIASRTEKDSIQLQKVIVDDDAHISLPSEYPQIVEFVGDSITAGLTTSRGALTSFAWLTSELLGVEHTQISYPAVCLVDGCNDAAPGMESQYFKWKGWQDDDNWDFSRYTPTAVVMMLGANDEQIVGQDLNRFQASYSQFLNRIRSEFPKAHLFVLSEPLGALFGPSQAAVQNLTDAGDKNVYFVDCTGWIQYGKAFNDEVRHTNKHCFLLICEKLNILALKAHPSDYGHQLLAKKLTPYIQAKLSEPSLPLPGPPANPNLPGLWQTMDIGGEKSVGLPGSVSFDSSDTFTLWGSGKDISSTEDAFRYLYEPASANTVMTVVVDSHSSFATCAKAGIMIREHLSASAPNVVLGVSPADGIIFQSRPLHGIETKLAAKVRANVPCYLKLERNKQDFFASWSSDGKDWQQVGELRGVVMANDAYIGLAVTSCDPSVVSVAKFSHVQINSKAVSSSSPLLVLQAID
ncbi:hypothetical protein NQZ79_g3651 [Umbelopsis isabellina]|nr:hypothetical protein NQZ79_g3651 [Umbelopsis isabellina]